MPSTPYPTEKIKNTVALGVEDNSWVNERAKRLGSFSEVIRELVSDARTFLGMPANAARTRLETEAKRLKLDHRDYLVWLLGRRADELLKEELQGGKTHR